MIAPWYALIYHDLNRIVARRGWNLALHGSMARDLDLILIPWVEDADSLDVVIDDIRVFVEGKANVRARERMNKKRGAKTFTGLGYYSVEKKPHGRIAITVRIGWSNYELDISIIPRAQDRE